MKKTWIICLLLIIAFLPSAFAQTPEITNGLTYLNTTQNIDGSWGDDTSLMEKLPSTVTVIETLRILNRSDTTNYADAVLWLQGYIVKTADYISERITVLPTTEGEDLKNILAYLDATAYAWGGYKDFKVNILDTALALRALKAVDYQDGELIGSALNYLTSTQNHDGGWGFCSSSQGGCQNGAESGVYMTALVSSTLRQFDITPDIATAINGATKYLTAHQNLDGGFGFDALSGEARSTIYETALAYMALMGVTTDATVLRGAVDHLKATQSEDGSWLQDPYATALAVRALHYSEDLPPVPPELTSGTITGEVTDAGTNRPLAGVSIQLQSDATIGTRSDATGRFTLAAIPQGTQTIRFGLAGYKDADLSRTVEAGSITDVGRVALSAIQTTGIIRGTVTDAENDQVLEGVTITVTGAHEVGAVTGADGTYAFNDVTPGPVTLTASKEGYMTVSGTGTVQAGGTLFFNPRLSALPPASSTGTLIGSIVDGTTQVPVQGAAITLSGGIVGASDGNGVFSIVDLEPGTYQVTISAVGYIDQSYRVLIIAGNITDIRTVHLTPLPPSTAINGVVTDAGTGDPIRGATITIVETGETIETQADGTYIMGDIGLLDFTVKARATGYDGIAYAISTSAFGALTVDFTLTRGGFGTLKIISLSSDGESYGANKEALLTATVSNTGDIEEQAVVRAEIIDADGAVVDIASSQEAVVSFAPLPETDTSIEWNTGRYAPGDYIVKVKLIEAGTMGYNDPTGTVLAERAVVVTIVSTPALAGGISLNPPVTQTNMQTPVEIAALIRNVGNVPITTDLTAEVLYNGGVEYSEVVTINGLQTNNVRELHFGSFMPQWDGTYTVKIKPGDQTIGADISTTLYSGPNATAEITVTPEKTLPGDVNITGTVHISGVVASTTQTQDPLAPLVRDAMQRGVKYDQAAVINWQNGNRCYGCHKQGWALYSLEKSKEHVDVDESVTQTLFSYLTERQQQDGSISSQGATYYINQTAIALRAFTAWHNETEAKPFILKSSDYLLGRQGPDGSWACDYCAGIFNTYVSIVGLVKAYELSGEEKYLNAITRAAEYLMTPGVVPDTGNEQKAQLVTALERALTVITDQALREQINTVIDDYVTQLRAAQRPDGGWGMNNSGSYAAATARILHALSLSRADKNDPALRNAVMYLLNDQNENGSWGTIWDNHVVVTSEVLTALPIVFERIGGIDTDIILTFPEDVTLNASSPAPTEINNNEYRWTMPGVMEEGADIALDLTLLSLLPDEDRPVAGSADLAFRNTFTDETIRVPIRIPTVLGASFLSIDVTTDGLQYGANEEVTVTVEPANSGSDIAHPAIEVLVEDAAGNRVDPVASFTAENLEPSALRAWAYRVPVEVIAPYDMKNKLAAVDVDFDSVLAALDIPGKVVDQNSVRIIEIDAAGNHIGEKEARAEFLDANSATITWLVDGPTVQGKTRYFNIYFDILDHGSKDPPEHTRVPGTGNLIAFTEGHGNIYLAESLGDGTFGTPWLLEDITEGNNYDNPGGIVLDDFNNDGFVDIVTGTSWYKWLWGELYYYENRADGSNTFFPKRSIAVIPAYGAIVDMTAADFNNDGNMDFVVSANTYTIYNKLHLFFGNGDGTFIEEILPNPAGIDKYRGKTSGDVNGDGNIDIVAVDKNGRIYLYLNNGNGTFMPPVVIGNCGDAPSGVATGDFDEDGHADIIVRGYYHGTKLLKGTGDGTFGAPAVVTSLEPGDAAHFATGDFNNDGHLDIIASLQTKMAIKAYLGKGDGTFVQTPLLGVTTSYAAGIDASPAIPEIYPALAAPEPAPPRTFQFIWNTGNASPGVYRIRAVLEESKGLVTEDTAVFEILPDIRVGARVVTDNTSYGAGESATVISTINGLSENTIIENLSAVVTVTDDQGGILHTDDYNAPILAPGQLMEHKTYWDTAAHQPGVYTVTVTIVHGDTLLRTAATTFEILGSSVTGAGLTGEITAEPDTADWGDDVAVQYSVVNGGNEDIADLQTTVLVVDPDIPEIQETLNGSADIVINGSAAGSGSVSTSNLSLGTYVALLRVSSDSMAEPKTLASAAFTVVDGTPPAVALISPEPASYCNSPITLAVSSTDDASGTASVEYRVDDGAWIPLTLTDGDIYSYTWIPASSDEGTRTITYRATDNAGNVSDPISITITVDLTPPDAPIIISPRDGYVSVKPTVTIEGAAEPLSTIEMVQKGITYRVTASDTGDFVFDGVALDRGDNAFEFTATDRAGNSSEETHHIITYTPIEISEGASELLNLLAWINSGHNEGYRHNDYCENRGLLETLIAGLTDSYTIVCDKKDFQKEMRNPFYTDVLIIGDRHTLEDHFGDELMEKIHGGMGIVSSKLHLHGDYGDDEERHGKYDPVFGVRHRGYLREGDYHTIETEESPITAGGEILEIAGGSAKIEVAGRTTVAGWIKKSPKLNAQSSQRKEDTTDTAYPAVVLNRYGDGRSVFHAFDVEATLNEITYNAVPDLLRNSLGYVHTAEEDEEIHPYEFIGRRIDLKNMAEGPVKLRIDITPSPGLDLYDPASGQWKDDDPWRMELQVPALETSSLTYYAFTPDTAGTYTVDVNILFKDGAEYTLFETVRKEITVRNSIEDLIEEITTDLSSIEDAEDAEEIREHLEGVRTHYTGPQKDVGKAIHECLMAVKQAKKRHYEDIRVKLNGLLESLEGLWFFGGSD